MSSLNYSAHTVPRLSRDKLGDKNFLRQDHYARLSRDEKGVLRNETIAVSNLYSTYDFGLILDIYSDGDEVKRNEYSSASMAKRIAHTGAMVIPYPNYGNDLGSRNWRRLRTDFVVGKYLSPLGKFSPPYRVLGFDHAPTIEYYKKILIGEVSQANKAKGISSTTVQDVAADVFQATQFDRIKNSYKNPKIPLLIVEGEFKALAILDAWMDAQKECIQFAIDNPSLKGTDLITSLNENKLIPPLFTCAGIGGVFNMIRKDISTTDVVMKHNQPTKPNKNYVIRPEWLECIDYNNRQILTCFDSDSKWILNVAHAASASAHACRPFGSEVLYVSIPSARGDKLGADDYIAKYGYRPFLNLVTAADKIAPGVPFNDIKSATRDGTSAIDYIIALAKQPIVDKSKQVPDIEQ